MNTFFLTTDNIFWQISRNRRASEIQNMNKVTASNRNNRKKNVFDSMFFWVTEKNCNYSFVVTVTFGRQFTKKKSIPTKLPTKYLCTLFFFYINYYYYLYWSRSWLATYMTFKLLPLYVGVHISIICRTDRGSIDQWNRRSTICGPYSRGSIAMIIPL